jgi:gamma-glutamylputrescine oxidase
MAPGLRIVVLENQVISRGASTRNAGFLCYGSPSEILEDIDTMGESAAIDLVQQRYIGLQKLKNTVPPSAAGIFWTGGKELFAHCHAELFENVSDNLDQLNDALRSAIGQRPFAHADMERSPHQFESGLKCINIAGEGQVQPAKLLKYISDMNQTQGVRLCEGLQVTAIRKGERNLVVQTDRSLNLRCRKVLIATNGFYRRLFPETMDVIPARNTISILKPSKAFKLNGNFHANRGYIYFRSVNGHLLIGGGRHWAAEEESSDEMLTNEFIKTRLMNFVRENLSGDRLEWKEVQSWSGILGIGPHKSPILSWRDDHILAAVRMSGMGVALSPVIGQKAAAMLLKRL